MESVGRCDRPLRLAILGSRGIPARYGGFETFAEKLAIGLVSRGHHVTVYAEGAAPDHRFHGVRVRSIPTWGRGPVGAIGYDLRSLWDARSGYDVVYMLGYGAAFACALPRWFGSVVWINIDGLEWRRSKWSHAAKMYLRFTEWCASKTADTVVADAQAIETYYRLSYPEGAPSVFVPYGAEVPGPVDLEWLASQQLVPGQFDLLIARLEPENQVLISIQAYAQFGDGHPLVVVGDHTADTPYVRDLIRQSHPNVRWLGAIYHPPALDSLRGACRCYIHGHSVGGTNPSLLEAMAAGCAVLAHDNPFNREVLGEAGIYFSSLTDLVALLTNLRLQNLDLLRREVRRRVTTEYTWESVIDRYEQLLKQAACRSC